MIKKLEVGGVHTVITEDLLKYVTKKIGGLDKYIPRHAQESAHAEVKLKTAKSKDKKKYTAEVILSLPHAKLVLHEAATTMESAIDAVENKIKIQLKSYKDRKTGKRQEIIAKIVRLKPSNLRRKA